jgi:hypothetical protein
LTLPLSYDKVLTTTTKGNIMQITVGDTYTTAKSGVTGVVQEIIEKPFGYVLRLDVDGMERFTTV